MLQIEKESRNVDILFNKAVQFHNPGDMGEGSYRVLDFKETVSDQEVHELLPLADHYIEATHSPRYVNRIKTACEAWYRLAEVQLSPESYVAMRTSAGLAIQAAQKNAFAITRPPGHHASKERESGFCFFNNVAIAAQYCLDRVQRVCIVDIDAHHGNGTQDIFCDNPRVLFCSVHQGTWSYPRTGEAHEQGCGNVVNVPLRPNSGDEKFLDALRTFQQRIEQFSPDVIGISVGVDGYVNDSICRLTYSKDIYRKAGEFFASLEIPLFAVLEGGYHQEVKECVELFVDGVNHRH